MEKCSNRYGKKLKLSVGVSTKKQKLDFISECDHKCCDHSGEVPPTGEKCKTGSPNQLPYEDTENPPREVLEQETTDANGKFINLEHLLDNYNNMEVHLPQGEI